MCRVITSKLVVSTPVGGPDIDTFVVRGIGTHAKCDSDEAARTFGGGFRWGAGYVQRDNAIMEGAVLKDCERLSGALACFSEFERRLTMIGRHFRLCVSQVELRNADERNLRCARHWHDDKNGEKRSGSFQGFATPRGFEMKSRARLS